MNWIALEQLLNQTPNERPVTLQPALDHAGLRLQALRRACRPAAFAVSRCILKMPPSWLSPCWAPGVPA